LKILTGVLVHRVTRPLRGSVSCGSGWSVPCVSIQLTLSQAGVLVHRVTRPLRGSVSCGSGWSVPCVSIQLTLSQASKFENGVCARAPRRGADRRSGAPIARGATAGIARRRSRRLCPRRRPRRRRPCHRVHAITASLCPCHAIVHATHCVRVCARASRMPCRCARARALHSHEARTHAHGEREREREEERV
jgi:hypothetical protein